MAKMIDKSDGRGCIGCAVETGKVCGGCTHKDDLVNDCKRINEENQAQREREADSCGLRGRNRKMMKAWGYKPIEL